MVFAKAESHEQDGEKLSDADMLHHEQRPAILPWPCQLSSTGMGARSFAQ
jgi:hypothetical protein